MFHLRLYMVLWVNTYFFQGKTIHEDTFCWARKYILVPDSQNVIRWHVSVSPSCFRHKLCENYGCSVRFNVLFYIFVGKLKGEILMSIHQKKLSLFSMKWKLPFLEKWGIPCWGKERNVKKCKFSSFVYIFKIGDFI